MLLFLVDINACAMAGGLSRFQGRGANKAHNPASDIVVCRVQLVETAARSAQYSQAICR